MNPFAWFAAHPALARLIVAFVAIGVAALINWAIETQAYHRRVIGPWSSAPIGASKRSWLDRVPIVGWWRLRREEPQQGKWFWLRPFLIEVVFPVGMLWLYDAQATGKLLPVVRMALNIQAELHSEFIAHFALIALMTVATFIDFDEQLIPDTITVPGTILGLVGSATMAAWFPMLFQFGSMAEMHAASNDVWPDFLNGPWGLLLALAIASGWCFGLLDRAWITRRGWSKAPRYFVAVMLRSRWWIVVGGLWIALMAVILVAWQWPIDRWPYLLSSLCGLAFAGGLTWSVRIAARLGLGVEALGFGDVTLMAMIGSFIGWQPSLIVFFVAPLVAVLIFVSRYMLTGDGVGPYGPYLCIATLLVVIFWSPLAESWALPVLTLPPQITLLILVLAVVIMGASLWLWHLLVGKVRGLGR